MSSKIDLFLEKYKKSLSNEALIELEEIKNEQLYLQKAFDHNPCTIALIDNNNLYLNANQKMLNLAPAIIGNKLGDLTKDPAIIELINKLKNSSEESVHQVLETCIGGERKVFWLSATRVGENVLTTGLDITSIKQLEEEKSFNSQLAILGEMSSFIIHEINNPLSTILMSTELIKFVNEDEYQNKELEQNTNNVFEMIKVMQKIISSLKSLSRKDKGEFKNVSIKEIIDKSRVILSGKIKKNFITIKMTNIDELTIPAYEVELLQVAVNLISNSIDAIQNLEEKWIEIKWENNCLKFIDSGSGISSDITPKLFNKFYSSKGEQGNGVGLYLSKNLLGKAGYDLVYQLENGNTSFQWQPTASKKIA